MKKNGDGTLAATACEFCAQAYYVPRGGEVVSDHSVDGIHNCGCLYCKSCGEWATKEDCTCGHSGSWEMGQ